MTAWIIMTITVRVVLRVIHELSNIMQKSARSLKDSAEKCMHNYLPQPYSYDKCYSVVVLVRAMIDDCTL